MKAFVLAAGLGTRLRPITNNVPKCLVPVCGKPLLGWWLELLYKHGITEILINLHYLPGQVVEFINTVTIPIKIKTVFEKELAGSGGTLRNNKDFVRNEDDFFVVYADNLTNYNLSEFYRFHRENGMDFSMALFRAGNPSACGIATLNENCTIVDFQEKPKNPKSDLANAGLYIMKPHILDIIPDKPLTDIGFDLLPQLVGKMAGWESKDFLMDIGTLENLKRASEIWQELIDKEKTH